MSPGHTHDTHTHFSCGAAHTWEFDTICLGPTRLAHTSHDETMLRDLRFPSQSQQQQPRHYKSQSKRELTVRESDTNHITAGCDTKLNIKYPPPKDKARGERERGYDGWMRASERWRRGDLIDDAKEPIKNGFLELCVYLCAYVCMLHAPSINNL